MTRREVALGAAALAVGGPGARAADAAAAIDPLETFVRMRASTDGRISLGWLDAVREVVIDGEITPFCRVLAGAVQSARRLSPEVYEMRIVEVAFYLDPGTGALLRQVRMPGTGRSVDVPIYRAGPSAVRFARSLDEWEHNDPAQTGAAAESIAPKGQVRLVRGVRPVTRDGDDVLVRADEYGRLYRQEGQPPSVFYREWTIWRGSAADLAGDAPSIPADYSYSALSSWRPWMKMGGLDGHTAENGRGAKCVSVDAWPEALVALMRAHHPDMIDNQQALMRA